MRSPSVTIRFNASRDEVIVDGRVFDRSTMSRADKGRLRRIIVGAVRQSNNQQLERSA